MKYIFLAFILSLPFLNALEPASLFDGKSLEHWEGEKIRILKADGTTQTQGIESFGNGIWSGNSQRWWLAEKQDASLTVEFTVPKGGDYNLHLAATKAVDYGIHSLTLNGKNVGKPRDYFQAKGVSHTGQIKLGETSVKKGKNTLVIKAIGAHPDSVKRYMFSLDFLRLAPTK